MNEIPDFQRGLLGTVVYFSPLLKLSVGIKKNITISQIMHYTLYALIRYIGLLMHHVCCSCKIYIFCVQKLKMLTFKKMQEHLIF